MTKLEKLKQLASEATPGPWSSLGAHGDFIRKVKSCKGAIAHCNAIHMDKKVCLNGVSNARYIAAANPETILKLLEERQELIEVIKFVRETFCETLDDDLHKAHFLAIDIPCALDDAIKASKERWRE